MGYLRLYHKGELLEQLELDGTPLRIGRAPDNDLVLEAAGVSSHHAEIVYNDVGPVIRDLNSTNGLFVNKKRVQEHQLVFHDEIQIFEYLLQYKPVARLAREAGLEVEGAAGADATVEVALDDSQALEALRQPGPKALLKALDGKGREQGRWELDDAHFSMGKAKDNDLRIGGWFAPAVAATLVREGDQWYLIPHRRGKVKVEGDPLKVRAALSPGQHFSVRGRPFVFELQKRRTA